jgi:hypothetical protein
MLITQAEWARRHGFSRQYVSRLVKQGIVRLSNGQIDPAKADAALTAMRDPARPLRRGAVQNEVRREPAREVADRPAVRPTSESLALPQSGDLPTLFLRTRIKSEVERARLLELKAKVESGRYVDAEEVAAAAFNTARIVRDALLSIADRLAPILAAESDAAAIHAALSSEIRTALHELTGGPEAGS